MSSVGTGCWPNAIAWGGVGRAGELAGPGEEEEVSPGSFGRGARHPSSSAPKHLCAIDLP